jgi:opacity protein-like surface antigen
MFIKEILMKKLLVVATLATLSLNAIAQSFKPGYYAGAELGATRVEDNAQLLANRLVAEAGGSASVNQDTSIGVGRVFFGYKVIENVDLELGYFQTGDAEARFSGVTRGNTPYNGVFKLSASGFDYSALIRPSISTGLNNAFIRLGGHSSKEELQLSGSSIVNSQTIKQSGTGMLYGAGYDINVTKNIDARLQITRLLKIAGNSDEKATVYSIGILGKF